MCEGGDIVTVDVDAQTVSVNGKTFKVGAVPENLYNIVANGGLIEDTKKRLAAGNVKMDIKPLSMEQCREKRLHHGRKDIKAKMQEKNMWLLEIS